MKKRKKKNTKQSSSQAAPNINIKITVSPPVMPPEVDEPLINEADEAMDKLKDSKGWWTLR